MPQPRHVVFDTLSTTGGHPSSADNEHVRQSNGFETPRARWNRGRRTVASAALPLLVYALVFFGLHYATSAAMVLPTADEIEKYLSQLDPGGLEVAFTPNGFEGGAQYLDVDLFPVPFEPYGHTLRSGSWYLTNYDLQLTPDAIGTSVDDKRSALFFEAHPDYWITYGSIGLTLDISPALWTFRNSERFYPFDTYPYTLAVIAERRPWSEESLSDTTTTQTLEGWEPMPVSLVPYLADVDGYRFDVRPVPYDGPLAGLDLSQAASDANDGYAAFEIRVRRETGIRMLVALVALVMILNLIALTRIVYRVTTSRRPPSAQILVWVAALAFATIAVRESLPQAPQPGILLDYALFFPVLLVAAGATLVIGSAWSTRDDFVP